MRLEEKFSRGINVQSSSQKYRGSFPTQITSPFPPSRPTEGRLEIVTDAGQDAVDAGCALTNALNLRTAKPCGPDAPTLASSVAELPASRRWQESPVTEESAEAMRLKAK
jgi:hypothetical protein